MATLPTAQQTVTWVMQWFCMQFFSDFQEPNNDMILLIHHTIELKVSFIAH